MPSVTRFYAALAKPDEWASASAEFEDAARMACMRARLAGAAYVHEATAAGRGAVAVVFGNGTIQRFLFPLRWRPVTEAPVPVEPEQEPDGPVSQLALFPKQEG